MKQTTETSNEEESKQRSSSTINFKWVGTRATCTVSLWKQTSEEPISLNSNCLLQADLWFGETITIISFIGSISSNCVTCYAEVLKVKGLLCWCCICFTHSTRWTQAKYMPACSDQDVYEPKWNHMQSKSWKFLATNDIQRSTWIHSMSKIGLTIWLRLESQ